MSISKLKYSILRLINYKESANATRFQRSAEYVVNPTKTSSGKWVVGRFLDPKDSFKSLKALESHWGNDKLDGRLFKHGIISFGSPDLKEKAAMDMMKDTLNFYKDYPLLWALHTDIPNRLHAHFLLGMRNLTSGAKFSQSKEDLRAFRLHFHKVAKRFNLLGLRDCQDEEPEVSASTLVEPFTEQMAPISYYSPPPILEPQWICTAPRPFAGVSQMTCQEQSLGQQLAVELYKEIKDDFHGFFELGFEGGYINGSK